jgi:hypothetical protein
MPSAARHLLFAIRGHDSLGLRHNKVAANENPLRMPESVAIRALGFHRIAVAPVRWFLHRLKTRLVILTSNADKCNYIYDEIFRMQQVLGTEDAPPLPYVFCA